MENILHTTPEIVFGSSDPQTSRTITRQVKRGTLRKLMGRVYTPNLTDTPEAIIRRNIYIILGHLYRGAVISHRSALEGGLTDNNTLFLTYKYTRKTLLPGITLRFLAGPGPTEDDAPFMEGLYIASRTRALLENMQPGRTRAGSLSKSWDQADIERHLDELCRIHGEQTLNKIRDQAKQLAKPLGMRNEYQKLDTLIGAILGTREKNRLVSVAGRARAVGVPYDAHRLELFHALYAALKQTVHPLRPQPTITSDGLRNLAFFEAYFSNYIEGTEFLVDEAAEMVFKNQPVPNRPADSHDVISTFKIISDLKEMNQIPESADRLIDLLRSRHATLLAARPEKHPGEFKEKSNRAGATVFVAPDLVRGTLLKGFEIYRGLEDPFSRAAFMMFLVAEVHPFTDGNGRVARIMMNAELVHGNYCRIVIPTVYREDYLLALRALSRQANPDPYLRMLSRAHQFTAQIYFNDYAHALATLTRCDAFLEPREGVLQLPQ